MQINDSLLRSCVRGDAKAQRQLYQVCFPYLMSVCIRYTQSKEEAMEYLNNGFYKILKVIDKFKRDGNFKAWSKRILINSIIDDMRKNKRYKSQTKLLEETELQWEVDSKQDWFDSGAVSAEEIYYYISELPSLTASVFNLFAIDGYKHQEIAGKLNIGLSASKWHYASAKKKLQARILAKMKTSKINIT